MFLLCVLFSAQGLNAIPELLNNNLRAPRHVLHVSDNVQAANVFRHVDDVSTTDASHHASEVSQPSEELKVGTSPVSCEADCGDDAECLDLCRTIGARICANGCSEVCGTDNTNYVKTCTDDCLGMQQRFCPHTLEPVNITAGDEPVDFLPEAELFALPYVAPISNRRAEDTGADFARPVPPHSNLWTEALVQTQEAIALLNEARELNNSTVLGSPSALVRAWSHVGATTGQKYAGFKLCVRVPIAGEEQYLTIDTAPVATELIGSERMIAVVRVDPEVDAMGHFFGVQRLRGEHIAPPDSRFLFPCHRHVETAVHPINSNPNGAIVALEVEKPHVLNAKTKKSHELNAKQPGDNLPGAYDSRAAYPNCAGSVARQGTCGASYAFATASVASERLCIAASKEATASPTEKDAVATALDDERARLLHEQLDAATRAMNSSIEEVARLRGEIKAISFMSKYEHLSFMSKHEHQRAVPVVPDLIELSAQELVSCGSTRRQAVEPSFCLIGPEGQRMQRYAFGCEGGTAVAALQYVHEFGLPRASCASFVSGGVGEIPHKVILTRDAPVCESLESKACHSEREIFKLGPPRALRDEASIKQAIFTAGPVLSQMDVRADIGSSYPDSFTEGVYVSTDAPVLGRHAVLIHGWGTSASGVKYWLGRNSWGTEWGLGGFFMIRRGTDEAGIESASYAADAGVGVGTGAGAQHAASECIVVERSDGSCVVINVCDSIRQVRATYLGGASNCGSWETSIPRLLPGRAHAETLLDAHLCVIEEDSFADKFDPVLRYEDVTSLHGGSGILPLCILGHRSEPAENFVSNAPHSSRVRCCGLVCAKSPVGTVASFPTKFCAAGCAEEGRQVYELNLPNEYVPS